MDKIKDLIPYVIILIVVIVLRTYVVTPVRVNGPSMDTTLKNGEIMILNKLAKIERGKIVVVDIGSEKVIKRVIGMPGDSIYASNGKLYVNDEVYEEDYTSSTTFDFTKVYLKDDEYFVMGDNRLISMDSRSFGAVTEDQIMGVTDFIIYPFTNFGKVK
jgi:signal peptidase I